MDVEEYMVMLDEQFEKNNIKNILTSEQIVEMKEACRKNFIENNTIQSLLPIEVNPLAQAIEDEELLNL
jgi:hypothetical protein